MNYVMDSSAILAYLKDEKGAEQVQNFFGRTNIDLYIHSVNLMEVHYRFTSFGGDLAANEALEDLSRLGVTVVQDFPRSLLLRASFFKTCNQFLSLADSICIALGEKLDAVVVTSDKLFARIKNEAKVKLIR